MTMTARFDDWEGQYLAHFRTKGSKNGVRRYQTESGEWTPLGLRERAKREGWGSEERKARRAENRAARAEKRAAASAARKERIAAYKEEKRKNNPKMMTDEELRKKIERAKMEQEYKELTRSPLVKTGANMVAKYLQYKEKKATAEAKRKEMAMKERQMTINETNAKANLIKAKAEKKAATDRIIDNLTGGSQRKKARAEFLKAKTERSKNTIRGAISTSIGNIIRKEGARTVSSMSNDSLTMRGGRKIKSLFKGISDPISDMAKRMQAEQAEAEKKRYRSNNPLKG